MAYHRQTTVVARRNYHDKFPRGALGSFLDDVIGTVKGSVKSGIATYGAQQQAAGAAAAAASYQPVAPAPSSGISKTTLLVGGGAALLALVLVLRKS